MQIREAPDGDVLINDLGDRVPNASSWWARSTDSPENQVRLQSDCKAPVGSAIQVWNPFLKVYRPVEPGKLEAEVQVPPGGELRINEGIFPIVNWLSQDVPD